MNEHVQLNVKIAAFQHLCEELAEKSGNPAHLLASLSTLQTFIASTVEPGEAAGVGYESLRGILDAALDTAREQVLLSQGQQLRSAVAEGDVKGISQVHQSLSRNGFQQAAERGFAEISQAQLQRWANWVEHWFKDAQTRASAASPYPDAMDFDKADIPMPHYLAMQDVRIFLVSQGLLPPV